MFATRSGQDERKRAGPCRVTRVTLRQQDARPPVRRGPSTVQLDGHTRGDDFPRVAIAHDYLTQLGGAEKVVLNMSRAFPDAPIYTMLYDPDTTFPEFQDLDVRVPAMNRIRQLRKHHRAALPILPMIARSVFVDADIVLTSSSGWAHGFRTNGRKLVYCHTPARWLYQSEEVPRGQRERRRADGVAGNVQLPQGMGSPMPRWTATATWRIPRGSGGGSPTRTASMPTSCSRPCRCPGR